MKHFTIGHRLPSCLSNPLFGARARYGACIDKNDPSWIEWQERYLDFYYQTQKASIGKRINDAGYEVMRHIEIDGMQLLEVGPGDIQHLRFWKGQPKCFTLVDVKEVMLKRSRAKLDQAGICHKNVLLSHGNEALPFAPDSFDVVLSFYSLEHIQPLMPALDDWIRVLRPGGVIVGAIPAEGGLAWGGGRFLTSRRWFKKNTQIDPDKIICWEHPNFAENILKSLDTLLQRRLLSYWPLKLPSIDLNLVVRFMYEKPAHA